MRTIRTRGSRGRAQNTDCWRTLLRTRPLGDGYRRAARARSTGHPARIATDRHWPGVFYIV